MSAVRNTKDVDLLLRRQDMEAVEHVLAPLGFMRRHVAGVDVDESNEQYVTSQAATAALSCDQALLIESRDVTR